MSDLSDSSRDINHCCGQCNSLPLNKAGLFLKYFVGVSTYDFWLFQVLLKRYLTMGHLSCFSGSYPTQTTIK